MFIHNFKYALKTLFKNKVLLFWTFAFPLILGTLFNLAFSNIENSEKLKVIDIAIVDNEQFNKNQYFKEAFKTLGSSTNEDHLFNIEYVNEEKANSLLAENKIAGYLIINDNPKVVIATNGTNQTVLKQVVEEINQTAAIFETLIKDEINKEIQAGNHKIDYEKIYQKVASLVTSNETNIKDISSSNLSYTMIEFYTLIAMACLYGGVLGMFSLNQTLPNMSNCGKRVATSACSKAKLIFSSVLASYLTQLLGIFILFMYTIFVLNVDYGNNLPLIILLALVGSLAGLAIGIAVSALCKANENVKVGIIITISMFGSFLSGMMGITMKYIVDKNIPILNQINPASMITDGFYSLYYYDTLNRYYFNVISLLIFSFIIIGISILSLRRQKYDSI